MATSYTSLLGLALPVTGELQGTWGDTVNNSITSLLDTAVAGTTTISTDGDVTLSTTTGAANQARQAILLCTGARTALRTITAPAQSKIYTIINATTGGFAVKLVGAGPTTGLTVPAGASALVAWNGSDFIEVGASTIGNLIVNGNLTVTGNSTLGDAVGDLVTINGTATFANANPTLSQGTANQVQFLDGSKILTGSSNFTWNGSTLAVTGTAAVTGAVTATADSSFTSTGALLISKGTTGQQPGSPATGMIRYNTTTNQFEGYSGSSPAWKSIGGSALSNDTSTSSNLYPVFAGATTGTAENLYTSNAKLLYKPSTGELSVSVPRASNGILVNTNTVAADYTIAATDNGLSAGPVSVNSGITVTVSSGAVWTVV